MQLRVGVDIAALGSNLFSTGRELYHLTTELLYKKIGVSLQYGYLSSLVSGKNFDYSVQGSYVLLGPDISLVSYEQANILLGIRYGQTRLDNNIRLHPNYSPWISGEEKARIEGTPLP